MKKVIIKREEIARVSDKTATFPGNTGYYSIHLDTDTGELYYNELSDGNSWIEFRDSDVILVFASSKHHTAKFLTEEIEKQLWILYLIDARPDKDGNLIVPLEGGLL